MAHGSRRCKVRSQGKGWSYADKAITRLGAKREQQLYAIITSSADLYGDPQGIAGNTMPEIEQLDLQIIEGMSIGSR